MKKIFTLVVLVAAFGFGATAQKLVVPYTSKAPVSDGYLDDTDDPWTGDFVDQATMSSGSSTSDASSAFQLLHDEDFIYIAVKVSDATPNNDAAAIGNSYERDCIELFFAMDTIDDAAGAYQSGDWQIRFQREAEEGAYIDGSGSVSSALLTADGFAWGVETASSDWVMEASFPKATLQQEAAFDGEFMKFEIQTADNTTGAGSGRTQQMFWLNGSDSQWNNTTTFSVIQLAKATSVSAIANTGSAFVQNEMLKVKNVNGVVNVYDLRGAVVRSAVVNGSASINIADLKSGMYVVKASNLSAKIVK